MTMPTYYEIEIVDASERELIKCFGELGYKVKGVVPPWQSGDRGRVILQRARCLPERGEMRDRYYRSLADNVDPIDIAREAYWAGREDEGEVEP